jgi:hypothetical protein
MLRTGMKINYKESTVEYLVILIKIRIYWHTAFMQLQFFFLHLRDNSCNKSYIYFLICYHTVFYQAKLSLVLLPPQKFVQVASCHYWSHETGNEKYAIHKKFTENLLTGSKDISLPVRRFEKQCNTPTSL